jgi:predicted TIM-barrel fold metal-dependent hydrolase
MIDNIFIFDCVIHRVDLSDQNINHTNPHTASGIHRIVETNKTFRAPEYRSHDYRRLFSAEDMYKMVFEDAPTDMAMAQTVPVFEFFEGWYAPVELQHDLAVKYPDRILFCGGVDPLYRGLVYALDHMEYQVKELGARSMKFYNGHAPTSWRCDDEKVAYPLYEKARNLGINIVQFHKGQPPGPGNVEDVSPLDLQRAARDFPDMTFIIHHLSVPWVAETISIAARYPNVYLALSGNIQYLCVAPRQVEIWLGECLQKVGVDRLLWGSEAALAGAPLPYLKAFMDMQISGDLQEGFGYPAITREDKEKILGLNFARVMGVDVEAKKKELGLVAA